MPVKLIIDEHGGGICSFFCVITASERKKKKLTLHLFFCFLDFFWKVIVGEIKQLQMCNQKGEWTKVWIFFLLQENFH